MKTVSQKILLYWFLSLFVVTSQLDIPPDTHALVEHANELINHELYHPACELIKPLADAGDPDAD